MLLGYNVMYIIKICKLKIKIKSDKVCLAKFNLITFENFNRS